MYNGFHQVHGYVVTSLSLRVLNGVVLVEGERDSVHYNTVSMGLRVIQWGLRTAVTLIGGSRVSLALEDVTKMAATVGADNLSALHTKGAVSVSGYSTRDSIEESRPAAARLELVVGLVERSLAAGTGVDTLGGHVLVKVAAVGRLGALVTEDAELLCYRVTQLSRCHR
jgi:hypothetical protein